MKKIISLLLALFIVFMVAGCTPEPEVREMTYQEMKELEDQIEKDLREELQEDFDRDLQSAIDKLEPEVITTVVYEETQIITQEVPREPTDDEWKAIREDVIEEVRKEVTAENEAWLQAEREKLTPIEVEVEKKVEVPIEGDEYSKSFMTCIVFPLESEPIMVNNGTIQETIVGSLFSGSYNIVLEESLPNGTKTLEYNKSTFSVCWFTFGEKPTEFDSLYPNLIPMTIPKKVEETN